MTPEEFALARAKLRESDVELARLLAVGEDAIRAWYAGNRKIPRRQARLIEWYAIAADRQAALERAGIEECGWIKSFDSQPPPDGDKEMESHLKRLQDHVATCPTCVARERFLSDRFPPMPEFPQPLILRPLIAWADVVERVPRLVRTPLLILPFVLVFGGLGVAVALADGTLKLVLALLFVVALLAIRFMR
jgi:hypothetical protein